MKTPREQAIEIVEKSFEGWNRTKPDGDVEKWLPNLADYFVADIEQALTQCAERERIATEALEFYADKKSWGRDEIVTYTDGDQDLEFVHDVMDDNGEVATKALAKIKENK